MNKMMKYPVKTDKDIWAKFSENCAEDRDISMNYRLNAWINHFVNEIGFPDAIAEAARGKKTEFKGRISTYLLKVDTETWNAFKSRAASYDVSANLLLNEFIVYFNENGPFINVNIEV